MDGVIKQQLKEIVGIDNFTDHLMDRVAYSYDASDHAHRPDGAVWPLSTQQVSQILILANKHRFTVIPRGAGTGLAGGVIPIAGGLVMDLCRMDRILDIRIPDRLAVVQPGVVYADLQWALSPHGYFFPPDPASGSVCTLGGNVATNAGGIKGAKYGVTKDYVLGLQVVLPTGRVMRIGSSCMKSSSGYDLRGLLVGSEGTLGVITEITLKIQPLPLTSKTGLAFFPSLRQAGQAVSAIMHSGIIPSALEILDSESIKTLKNQSGLHLPEAEAMILAETDGYTEAEVSFQMARVIDNFKGNGAMRIQTANSTEEAESLWFARKRVGSAAGQLRPNNASEDVTIPLSRLPDLLTAIAAVIRPSGLPFVIFGHAGDGNLHPKIMYDRSDPHQREKVKDVIKEIFRLTCQMGGTLTGEHGIGLAKAPYMPLEHDPVAMDVMRSLKGLFDPNHILNPGKLGLMK